MMESLGTGQTTWPWLFILGAAKSGTTTLYQVLGRHSNICLSRDKETAFFSNDDQYNQGYDYYLHEQFSHVGGELVVGEATPQYLVFPKVAKRLSKYQCDCGRPLRFIVILRNPIDVSYAWYWHLRRLGIETEDFEVALRMESERRAEESHQRHGDLYFCYQGLGLFASQLREYFQYFDRSQFLILFLEDLVARPASTLRSVQEFLGLAVEPLEAYLQRDNAASWPRSMWVQRAMFIGNPLRSLVRGVTSRKLRGVIRRRILEWNLKPFSYPQLDSAARTRLGMAFESDIRELEEITGRELGSWLES